jgi:hypothetical protein
MTQPPTPPPPLTLAQLRERARAMESGRKEVDELLVALSRPVWPGENVRQRAEQLHLILDDPWLGGFRGSDGRLVSGVAAQALVALGEPYASELSEAGREALKTAPPLAPRPGPDEEPEETAHKVEAATLPPTYPNAWRVTGCLAIAWGCTELVLMARMFGTGNSYYPVFVLLFSLLQGAMFSGASLIAPGIQLVLRPTPRHAPWLVAWKWATLLLTLPLLPMMGLLIIFTRGIWRDLTPITLTVTGAVVMRALLLTAIIRAQRWLSQVAPASSPAQAKPERTPGKRPPPVRVPPSHASR